MKKKNELSESMEDYLEVILDLEKTNKVARAKDIAERLDVKRGSVTGALKLLHEKELINYEPYSFITLTQKGSRIAKRITKRHNGIRDFLQKVLQLDAKTADANACRMEHAIDEETMKRLMCLYDYIHKCPRTGPKWLENFAKFCTANGFDQKECRQCMSDNLDHHL